MSRTLVAFSLAAAAFSATAPAQLIEVPQPSPRASVTQRIGLTDVTVTYSRPSANGRKVWGGLVPYGEVWRAGANQNTTIELAGPLLVEGKPLAKGVYGLHMIPTADSCTVIFSKTSTAWGSYTYDQKEDALRVEVKPKASEMRESLAFEFDDVKKTTATLTLRWDKVAIPVQFAASNEESVLPVLRAQLRGQAQYTWDGWFNAANWCLDQKTNYDEALKWAERSIQVEERFENVQLKADLLKALNRTDDAAKAVARALEIGDAPRIYTYARQQQNAKEHDKALETFKVVVKRFPGNGVYTLLAQARLASAAGNFDQALKDAKAAQAASGNEAQKKAIQTIIDRLAKKEDINK